MKFNSIWSAKNKIEQLTGCFVDYTNEGLEVSFTASEMQNVESVFSKIKNAGFGTAKIVGIKWKKILVNYTSIEVQRGTVISVDF